MFTLTLPSALILNIWEKLRFIALLDSANFMKLSGLNLTKFVSHDFSRKKIKRSFYSTFNKCARYRYAKMSYTVVA
jgi:hypothetical protein